MKGFFTKIRYLVEYLLFLLLLKILSLLSLKKASNLFAKIGQKVGPYLPVDKVARKNIAAAMPELQSHEIDKIMFGLWDNFGRYIGEFAHISTLTSEEFDNIASIEGLEHINSLEGPAILCTGHFANWDLMIHIARKFNTKMGVVYRKINNPYIDKKVRKIRERENCFLIEKGAEGAKELIRSIKRKYHLTMLIDQKMNEGIELTFFNRPAMTAPATGKFALQFNYPIIPVQLIRTGGVCFHIKVHPPLKYRIFKDKEKTVHEIMQKLNNIFEGWIRQHPEQWFWLHNRWK